MTTEPVLSDSGASRESRPSGLGTKPSDRIASGLSWMWAVAFTTMFIAYFFPPLNWGDEPRNIQQLEDGNYGFVYWRVLHFVRDIVSGFTPIGSFDADTAKLIVSNGWRPFNGSLRYNTESGDASSAYYIAKIGNLVIILVFVLAFAAWKRAKKREPGSAGVVQTFILCLLMPAVAYQSMQISTDLLFILMSIGLYFVDSRRGRIIYSALAFVLIIEDRSFVILGVTGLAFAISPSVIRWRSVVDRPGVRAAVLAAAVLVGIAIGTMLSRNLQGGASTFAAYLSGFEGFQNIQQDVELGWTRNFNTVDGPIFLFAGLVYWPSRAEFAMYTIPLYLLALPVAWRMLKIAIIDRTERGSRYFFLLSATLLTFFTITHTTHVFEGGRYYFTLIPLLVVAIASYYGESGTFIQNRRVVGIIGGGLIALNVIITLFVAILT